MTKTFIKRKLRKYFGQLRSVANAAAFRNIPRHVFLKLGFSLLSA